MRMRHIGTVQYGAINTLSPLPYCDLLLAARSALSQPCLQHSITCMQVCS